MAGVPVAISDISVFPRTGQLVRFRKHIIRGGESKINAVTSRLVTQVVDCDIVQTKVSIVTSPY